MDVLYYCGKLRCGMCYNLWNEFFAAAADLLYFNKLHINISGPPSVVVPDGSKFKRLQVHFFQSIYPPFFSFAVGLTTSKHYASSFRLAQMWSNAKVWRRICAKTIFTTATVIFNFRHGADTPPAGEAAYLRKWVGKRVPGNSYRLNN